MKMSGISLAVAFVLAACGTETNPKQGRDVSPARVQAAQGDTRPAAMPKMVLVKVREDGRGDVLAGSENVEVRTVHNAAELSAETIANVFANGKPSVILDNSDDLNGGSSEGQFYWRGYYGWGWGRAAWGWGNYGYTNWYRPTYWYGGNNWNYGYNSYWNWGGYRYYCYW